MPYNQLQGMSASQIGHSGAVSHGNPRSLKQTIANDKSNKASQRACQAAAPQHLDQTRHGEQGRSQIILYKKRVKQGHGRRRLQQELLQTIVPVGT